MVAHRQLVIGLVLYCASFVEVVAESVDETCAQDAQQHNSQGEALLQVDSKRAAAHQQQHDKAMMGPQGLKLLSQGHSPHEKGVHLTSKAEHAATPHADATEDSVKAFVDSYGLHKHLDVEKAAKHTSKKEEEEFDFGDDENVNIESEEEENAAKKNKLEGKMVKPIVEGGPKHKKGGHYDEKGKLAKAEAIYDEREETEPKTESGPVDENENDEDAEMTTEMRFPPKKTTTKDTKKKKAASDKSEKPGEVEAAIAAMPKDSENTDGKKTDKKAETERGQKMGHGGQKGNADKRSLLVVKKGEKAKKGDDKTKKDKHKGEKVRQQPDEEDPENNNDDPIPHGQESNNKKDDKDVKNKPGGKNRRHKHKHDENGGGYEYEYEYNDENKTKGKGKYEYEYEYKAK